MPKETLSERLAYYEKLIPAMYPEKFPTNFELRPSDWSLTENTLSRPSIPITVDGEQILIRPLSTMDVEFLSNETILKVREGCIDLVKNYPCGLRCPNCFSEEEIFGDKTNLMSWQEVFSVIDVARSIGLTSIKFLGPGELFQNPDLFDILDACHERSLPISIFTKGAELGDDELAAQNFGHLGISTAQELVHRVLVYPEVRILLGFNSFFPERQNALVGSANVSAGYTMIDGIFERRGVAHYTQKRDQALKNLYYAGLSNPAKGQRLSLIMAPLQRNQNDEVAEMFLWAARRNIPLVIAPTMESGPKAQRLVKILKKGDPTNHWLFDAYLRVYRTALQHGITSLESLERKGISSYLGTEACNQVANGIMLRLNGQVKICPGSSRADHIYGNVHQEDGTLDPQRIIRLWLNSYNYSLGAMQNNWCPAKQEMLPRVLAEGVLGSLRMSVGVSVKR
jgi:hypothetical protein